VAIDPTFTANTELRLLKIERAMTSILQLLRNAINKEQMNRLTIVNQQNRAALITRMDTLESQITQLQEMYDQLL
jgi:hypothetical protein